MQMSAPPQHLNIKSIVDLTKLKTSAICRKQGEWEVIEPFVLVAQEFAFMAVLGLRQRKCILLVETKEVISMIYGSCTSS